MHIDVLVQDCCISSADLVQGYGTSSADALEMA